MEVFAINLLINKKLIYFFYFFSNGINVEGSTHRQVVELIKEGGECLQLVVISVNNDEIDSDSTLFNDDNHSFNKYDYSDKRSLPITIPSYQNVCLNGECFVAYNIHMAGRHLGSRRFSEFVQLNSLLKVNLFKINFNNNNYF